MSCWKVLLEVLVVALSVSVSNTIWFFCAFLGVARPWNGTVALEFVLAVAFAVCGVVFVTALGVLKFASRDAPSSRPDWIDSVKASLSQLASLRQH